MNASQARSAATGVNPLNYSVNLLASLSLIEDSARKGLYSQETYIKIDSADTALLVGLGYTVTVVSPTITKVQW